MSRKILIIQSNYIPWKGYFDAIKKADILVLYDDAQYTKNDWRNRNLIKTKNGPKWLTIPISISGNHFHKINEMQVSEKHLSWPQAHWSSIYQSYVNAPFFKYYEKEIKSLYLGCEDRYLSRINYRFLTSICSMLDIDTEFLWSDQFELKGDRSERLLNICLELKATHYISGPAAKDYLNESIFAENGIGVEWMDYSGYPEYPQLYPPFTHAVSIIDLLFNCGPEAKKYFQVNSQVINQN